MGNKRAQNNLVEDSDGKEHRTYIYEI